MSKLERSESFGIISSARQVSTFGLHVAEAEKGASLRMIDPNPEVILSTPPSSDPTDPVVAEADLLTAAFKDAVARYKKGIHLPLYFPGLWRLAAYVIFCRSKPSRYTTGWREMKEGEDADKALKEDDIFEDVKDDELDRIFESKEVFGIVVLYGDPSLIHERTSAYIERLIVSATTEGLERAGKSGNEEWDDLPTAEKYVGSPLGSGCVRWWLCRMENLLQFDGSSDRTWHIGAGSSQTSSCRTICKEPDRFVVATANTKPETGIAVEVAYRNESANLLCKEVKEWTKGTGQRAQLCIGIKIDDRNDRSLDPYITFVTSNSLTTPSQVPVAIPCGRNSFIPPAAVLAINAPLPSTLTVARPAAPALVSSTPNPDPKAQLSCARLDHATMIILPIGAALFKHVDRGFLPFSSLSHYYLRRLCQIQLEVDLSKVRRKVVQIVQDAYRVNMAGGFV